MKFLGPKFWVPLAIGAAVVIGCVSEQSESLLEGVGKDDETARNRMPTPMPPIAGPGDASPADVMVRTVPNPAGAFGNGNANGGGNTNTNGGNDNTNGGNTNTNGGNTNTNGGNTNTNDNTNGGNTNTNGGNTNTNGGNTNTNDNTNGGNTNTNGGNTNTNGGNTNTNGGNTNTNGGNTNTNGGNTNTNDNTNGGNTNTNGGNTNTNGDNGNVNGGNGNSNVNGGGGNGICPNGSTRVKTDLSGGGAEGDSRYRSDNVGCEHFRARVDDAQPFASYQVMINGVVVGTIFTDDDGKGELEFDTGQFPASFPDTVLPGDVITIGPLSGVYLNDCSSGSGCS